MTANSTLANPWLTHRVRIERIKPEIAGISTFDVSFVDEEASDEFAFQPGQFNMLYLPGFGESAISVSSDAESLETISHTVRSVGDVTKALFRKQVGDELMLRGPYGTGWPVESCRGQDIVIACGGLGIAPIRP